MKPLLTIIFFIGCCSFSKANNLEIANLTSAGSQLTFDLSWDNSWRNTLDFHDAAWLFVKQSPNGGPSWLHANILSATVSSGFQAIVSDDNVGVTIRRSNNGNGSVSMTVTLTLDDPIGIYRDYKVMGTEMVYVPEGSFYLGDGWSEVSFQRGDDPLLSYHVTSEAMMNYGSSANDFKGGNIYNDIPAEYPKGYSAFYSMKYQITMGQYVDFLNCQPRSAQDSLTNADLSGTTVTNRFVMTNEENVSYGNPISCDSDIGSGNINFYCDLNDNNIGNEYNDGQFRAVNRLRIRHLLAYLDWSGLAPMTELEYEKACRGPLPAVAGEYAWGSTLRQVQAYSNIVNEGEATEKYLDSGTEGGLTLSTTSNFTSIRVGCNAPASGGDRELSNASYYGISGLSMFRNCVFLQIEVPYSGQHGDGVLQNGLQNSFGNIERMRNKGDAGSNVGNGYQRVSTSIGYISDINESSSGRGVRRI